MDPAVGRQFRQIRRNPKSGSYRNKSTAGAKAAMIYRPLRELQILAVLNEESLLSRILFGVGLEKLELFKFFSRIGSYAPTHDYKPASRPLRFDGRLFVAHPPHHS